MQDARDDIATWPRERVKAAVDYARSWCAIPEEPMHPNPQRWEHWQAVAVQGADEILAFLARRRLTDAAQSVDLQQADSNKEPTQ